MLRDGHEVENEVFYRGDVADKWQRPLYWVGFLVVDASTRPPLPCAGGVKGLEDLLLVHSLNLIDELDQATTWCRSVKLKGLRVLRTSRTKHTRKN